MGNGRKVRRHVATEKVNPDKGLPKHKPVVYTEIKSYRVALDEHMNDLSQRSGGSSSTHEHMEPGIKYEVNITVAPKQYDESILPTHDEVQECLTALFRRTVEKKTKCLNKNK